MSNGSFNEAGALGRPVQVVFVDDDEKHSLRLDEPALRSILERPDVRDKRVAIISIAGAYRKGKSFLLGYLLRYLNARGARWWLGNENTPLEGFHWRGGQERDTIGIIMWSEPFFVEILNCATDFEPEVVAVLLMDTQGAFDGQSTVNECTKIFALSTLLSSVQVFNLMNNLQEDDLQHLQLFTEYGRLALAETGAKPFQRLLVLVRDWYFPSKTLPFGSVGGKELLRQRMAVTHKTDDTMRLTRNNILACFNQLGCFLLPHPGIPVATDPDYDGNLKAMEENFREQLADLVPMLLAPENLVLKQIGGQKVKAEQIVQYFKSYMAIFQEDNMPDLKSIVEATAEGNNLAAMSEATRLYQDAMEESCGSSKPYMHAEEVQEFHVKHREAAVDLFCSIRKMGGPAYSKNYLKKLEEELDAGGVLFLKRNDGKYNGWTNFFKTLADGVKVVLHSCGLLVASVVNIVTVPVRLFSAAIVGLDIWLCPYLVTSALELYAASKSFVRSFKAFFRQSLD